MARSADDLETGVSDPGADGAGSPAADRVLGAGDHERRTPDVAQAVEQRLHAPLPRASKADREPARPVGETPGAKGGTSGGRQTVRLAVEHGFARPFVDEGPDPAFLDPNRSSLVERSP